MVSGISVDHPIYLGDGTNSKTSTLHNLIGKISSFWPQRLPISRKTEQQISSFFSSEIWFEHCESPGTWCEYVLYLYMIRNRSHMYIWATYLEIIYDCLGQPLPSGFQPFCFGQVHSECLQSIYWQSSHQPASRLSVQCYQHLDIEDLLYLPCCESWDLLLSCELISFSCFSC